MTSMSEAQTLLVVDDTPANIGVLLELFGRQGFKVLVAPDAETALEQLRHTVPDLILLDVVMPGMDGFEACRRLKADPSTKDVPVIFMTARAATKDCIEGFRAGAADYVVKPFQQDEVLARVNAHLTLARLNARLRNLNHELELRVDERTAELRAALDEVQRLKNQLEAENTYLQGELREQHRDIVGTSPGLRAVLSRVASVASTDSTVLITGETGTGKELIARAVHEASRRRARPMVKLNCAAIATGLIESELFGHVRGAFTGATERRTGRFELANGGTLFLDEISELPLDNQVKLLRVLQEREFEPVGSSKTMRADVRVIAATNRDLQTEVDTGRFRSDLYYRLNVFPLEVPPLRDRREDIELLAQTFVARASRRLGRRLSGIHPVALRALLDYEWPGNIRELENTIERAAILSPGDLLSLPFDLGAGAAAASRVAPTDPETSAVARMSSVSEAPSRLEAADGSMTLEAAERGHLVRVLAHAGGVIEGPNGAAQLLGLKPSTLRSRMKKLGIRSANAS